MSASSRVPASARTYFLALTLLAAAVTAFQLPDSWPPLTSWAAGVIVLLVTRFPLLVMRRAGGLEVGLDPVIALFLAFSDAPHAAVVWTFTAGVAQLFTSKASWVRLFNAAVTVLSGAAALAVVAHLDAAPLAGGRSGAVTAVVAAACYYLVDYLLSVFAIVSLRRATLREAIWDDTAPLTMACVAAAGSLGYVGAVLVRTDPWTLPLAGIPLVTVVLAGRAFATAHGERMRVHALFTAAERQHSAATTAAVLEAAVEAGREALAAPVELREVEPVDGVASTVDTPDGARWIHATTRNQQSRVFTQSDRELLEVLASLTNDSLRRQALVESLERMAATDALTGLANAAAFRAAVRSAGPGSAVLFCDLDGFKGVNDDFGHEAGDALLCEVADRLRGCVREGDVLARNGGDEFAVLLVGADAERAEAVAQRVVEVVAAPISLPGVGHAKVTVSVGTATGDGALVQRADIAMYAAKAAGKSRHVVCTDELFAAHQSRRTLADELGRAIDRDELVLHYQPIVNLALDRIDGVEALVRWQHPERGLLGPGEFVHLAEETGTIDDLTRWVQRRAVQDAVLMSRLAGRQISVSVNVSPSSLVRGVLLDQVESGCTDDVQLILEVTETAVAEPAAVPVLEEFRRRGVRIALDDFGTGHSSLATLRLLPVDIIKLDRAFIEGIAVEQEASLLVRSVAELARALAKPLVVEGIEDAAQRAELERLGVALGQGYHLARPAPLDVVLEGLRQSAVEEAASLVPGR
ncbi:diguanylate cyclase (GGDEF)-like protein [Motilibacter peucedani]|uniref:Diguanylate cyclase (GGDEF)-like protein n=1 Tax=Motilibacter peucedani TaxID=598650 RepID=A0A420XTF0_9ACTN|nr:EAL domain-containing protein [Motilibacter peucedani]RKS79949.1 diguanylate cyclase (GGDEF)-like protein [Motilibacter peucedani]